MSENSPPTSPRWGTTIKIIIGLSFAISVGAILVAFRSIIGPLLLSIIIAYFLHPVVVKMNNYVHLKWRTSVTIVYLLLIVILIGLFTAIGVAVVGQTESLFQVVRNFVNNELPDLLDSLSETTLEFGPLMLDFSQFDFENLNNQFLNNLQSLLGQAGGLIGALATGAAGILGWTAFILLVSYFLLADAGRFPDTIRYVTIPGYDYDIRRISRKLGHIWDTYLRGQFLIILMVMLVSVTLMTVLGVRYALAIALLTGLARFVPYIGPLLTNLITFVVAVFQSSNYFGLNQVYFAIIVVVIVIFVDQFFDNYISPRMFGQRLGIHPAAVLVAALILAQFIGFIGLVLAAPVLASLQLISRYSLRKIFDLDPWPEPESEPPPVVYPWQRLANFWSKKITHWQHRSKDDQQNE